jgi:hypothetical protein
MDDPENLAEGSSPFHLSKWYLDCVAENGDGAVIYVADLQWKSWHIRYASAMSFLGDKVTTRSSIRKCALPESKDDQISLKLPHLELEGRWNRRAAPVDRTVFTRGKQGIVWRCLQPASDVNLVLKSAEITGLGYAELLEMSIAPWKLPLDDCFRLIVHNGKTYDSGSISENEISMNSDLKLVSDCGLVLRAGTLGKTVLPTLVQLSKVLPGSLLTVDECKWRSRSMLIAGGENEEGWSIHEVVRWRQ